MPNQFMDGVAKLKNDGQVVWRPGYIFIPVINFTGLAVGAINEGGAGNFAYGLKWEGSHTGAPVSQEISTFGVNGVLLDTAADEVNTTLSLPGDLDLAKRIYARVHWTSGSADVADTITWKLWYKAIIPNTTAISAIGNSGGTALDKVIPQQTQPVATAYTWCVTQYGYIDAGKLDRRVEVMLLSLEMDAFAAGLAEDKFPLAVELRYTPKRLWGPTGMGREAVRPSALLGDQYREGSGIL